MARVLFSAEGGCVVRDSEVCHRRVTSDPVALSRGAFADASPLEKRRRRRCGRRPQASTRCPTHYPLSCRFSTAADAKVLPVSRRKEAYFLKYWFVEKRLRLCFLGILALAAWRSRALLHRVSFLRRRASGERVSQIDKRLQFQQQ